MVKMRSGRCGMGLDETGCDALMTCIARSGMALRLQCVSSVSMAAVWRDLKANCRHAHHPHAVRSFLFGEWCPSKRSPHCHGQRHFTSQLLNFTPSLRLTILIYSTLLSSLRHMRIASFILNPPLQSTLSASPGREAAQHVLLPRRHAHSALITFFLASSTRL